jgi:signal transduction histidine kinase
VATRGPGPASRTRATAATAAVAVPALVVLAARADISAAHASLWTTLLDIAVGLAFVAGAGATRGRDVQRGLIALVGVAWLAGSVWPVARPWHQAALVVALTAFPEGRVGGLARGALLTLAAIVAVGTLPQIGVATVFAAVAVAAGFRHGSSGRFPTIAGAAVAAVLGSESLIAHRGAPDPTSMLVGYEVVLLGVAVGFPCASRAVIRARTAVADQLLVQPRVPALDGLAAILGQVIGDANLQIYRWQGSDFVDGRGQCVAPPNGSTRWLQVADSSGPIAVVAHNSLALQDPPTTEAVTSAVRLAVTHIRLREEQQSRLLDMEAARARIVAASDRQRQQVAAQLRKDVEPSLQDARSELNAARTAVRHPSDAMALGAVADELSAASAQIAGLVAGVPPAHLGGGRLSGALASLVATCPVPLTVTVDDATVGDQEAETAVFYVCSEALTNAVKHSHATHIDISVRLAQDSIVASVSDDGCGGAIPSGSGLQGLADRVATRGGRLQVDSPPGAGTKVTATIPASRFSSTA